MVAFNKDYSVPQQQKTVIGVAVLALQTTEKACKALASVGVEPEHVVLAHVRSRNYSHPADDGELIVTLYHCGADHEVLVGIAHESGGKRFWVLNFDELDELGNLPGLHDDPPASHEDN